MKKNLIKITAAAFAATMAFGTTGLMAYADEDGAAVETPIVIERSPETPAEETPAEETPTNAPAETPAEEPTLTEVPYTGEPTEETPTEAVEAPTEEIIVTTVTTEVAVIETQTTAIEGTTEAAVTTATTQQDYSLLTSGSWRSNKGDYIFDASRPSGVITSNGSQTNFTYDVSGSTVTINYGSTSVTGTFSVSSADNFTISWNDGSVETFTRQASSTSTTTTAKTSSSSTSTTKSSSSSKSSSSAPAGKTDSPKTGDDFHALPIAAFALTGAAVCFISFRKREND